MTEPRPTNLSPEERTLAEQLARVGPRGEPSPALDSRVLASARAALDQERSPVRIHRRWPLAVGLAASLVLAVGIAWRVRPLPPGAAPSASPEAARSMPDAAPAQVSRDVSRPTPAPDVADTTQPAAARKPDTSAGGPASSTREKAAASDASTALEIDVPPAVATPAAPSPAPAPPPAARPVMQSQAAPEPTANAAMDAARVPSDAGGGDSTMAAAASPESGSTDEPMDATPPATADAPGVRDAWLLRIRTLIDNGNIADGRRSLRAFVERYPDYPLPEDLRALLQ